MIPAPVSPGGRRTWRRGQAVTARLLALIVLLLGLTTPAVADPLPSWQDTAPKQSIIAFVRRVTTPGPEFVAGPARIAVFDNDGTLWPENPMPFQAAFAFDEIRRRAATEPKLAADPAVKALLAGDIAALMAGGHHDGLMRLGALTHAGMTTDEFAATVESWIKTAHHPKFKRPYD